MIYLSGHIHDSLYGVQSLGFMMTPHMGNRPNLECTLWGADTGCFKNPDSFVLSEYLSWLMEWPARTMMFATAPDRLADHKATLEVSLPVLEILRPLKIGAAFVAQNGAEPSTVPWREFDCLFLGGAIENGKEWKESRHAERLAREARSRGKWVHMGRVNSRRRIQIARDFGCGSVDGTYLKHGRDILRPNLEWWLKWANDQGQFAY